MPYLVRAFVGVAFVSASFGALAQEQAPPQPLLHSLPADQALSVLNLGEPGLETARSAEAFGERSAALSALLQHYRTVYPKAPPETPSPETLQTADRIVNHIFQWGPYEPADYGKEVDWDADPRGDIEWVAAMYRFYWAGPLAAAYRQTSDEKYADAFVKLASDWIAKHPLEQADRAHPIYTKWRGYAWLDIQTGRRAESICQAFPSLVHAQVFTPEFLGLLLASLYDHQVKTETFPLKRAHNKAIFEQRGFVEVARTFPEFKDSTRWLQLALDRTRMSLLEQTTNDGVQREWALGYHRAVLDDALWIMQEMKEAGVTVPDDMRDRAHRMADYLFAVATPDLGYPMFGDASRPAGITDRQHGGLYKELIKLSKFFHDPKYRAYANLDLTTLPKEGSFAFPEAGAYVLRNGWGTNGIYFAMHNPPPALSSHDQPDNGTFELFAYGRWLMTDTGFYTYGHDEALRAWHRQTRVHQTLTLDGKDSKVQGRQLLWSTTPELDTIVIENEAYPELRHWRTVWFVEHSFLVILDEAVGEAAGALDLHFQFAPGDLRVNAEKNSAHTMFEDSNVLVATAEGSPVRIEEEEGWTSSGYGQREPRRAIRFRHTQSAPAAFLTVVHPYRGAEPPKVSASLPAGFRPGDAAATVVVEVSSRAWNLSRAAIAPLPASQTP